MDIILVSDLFFSSSRTVRTDKSQEVDGAVTFDADVEVKSLSVPNNIMGVVDLRVLFNESMLRTGEQVLLTFFHHYPMHKIHTGLHAY